MTVCNLGNHPKRRNQSVQSDAKFLADLKAMGAEGAAVLEEMLADTARQIELTEPWQALLPGLQLRFYPALLALLGRLTDAAELAVLLARDTLLEDGEDANEEAVAALVKTRYLTLPLLEAAEQAHRGTILPQGAA